MSKANASASSVTRRTIVIAALIVFIIAGISIYLVPTWFSSRQTDQKSAGLASNAQKPLASANTAAKLAPASSSYANLKGAAKSPIPLPPPNVPIAQMLPALREAAAQGDIGAACRVGYELDRCKRNAIDQRELVSSKQLLATREAGTKSYISLARFIERMQASVTKNGPICEGVAESDMTDGWQYSYQAAASGNPQAMVKFILGQGLETFPDPLANPTGWATYAENFKPFLDRAITSGVPEALEVAAFAHQRPMFGRQLVEKDVVRAVAYYRALQFYSTQEYSAIVEGNIKYIIEKNKLTAADVERAAAMAADIRSKIATPPKDSVDLTKSTPDSEDGKYCSAN